MPLPKTSFSTSSLVGVVGYCVHVGYVEGGALDGDQGVVDLGAVAGVEGVDLAAVGGVDLVEVLDPADAGQAAVVVEILVLVGVGDDGGWGTWCDGGDDGGGVGAEVEHGEAVVVGLELGSLAVGAVLRADPEGVVVGEEEFAVHSVGDAVLAGDGFGGDVDGGEFSGEEAIGQTLLACYIECGAVREGCGDSSRDGDVAGDR